MPLLKTIPKLVETLNQMIMSPAFTRNSEFLLIEPGLFPIIVVLPLGRNTPRRADLSVALTERSAAYTLFSHLIMPVPRVVRKKRAVINRTVTRSNPTNRHIALGGAWRREVEGVVAWSTEAFTQERDFVFTNTGRFCSRNCSPNLKVVQS